MRWRGVQEARARRSFARLLPLAPAPRAPPSTGGGARTPLWQVNRFSGFATALCPAFVCPRNSQFSWNVISEILASGERPKTEAPGAEVAGG